MAEIDSLEIKITSDANSAKKSIDSLSRSLEALSKKLKFDTSSLEKLGNVNGESFRSIGEGIKSISSGLQNLQGIKKSDFNRLSSGIERIAKVGPGNIGAIGNAIKPLADGINILSNAKFDNKNIQGLINSLTRLSNANTGNLANIDFSAIGNSIKGLAGALSSAPKVQQNTISMTNAIAKLANAGQNANITSSALPELGLKLRDFIQTMAGAAELENGTIAFTQAFAQLASAGKRAESAAVGIPKLGEELKKVFDVMSSAPKLNQSTIQFTQALAQLASAGGNAGVSASNLAGRLNILSASMQGLRNSTSKAVGGLRNFGRQLLSSVGITLGIYGAIRGIRKALDISSDLTEVQNVVDVTFGNMAHKVEDFARTSIEQFGLSELALKQYSSRFQAMGVAMGISPSIIGAANKNLSSLTEGYVSASDSISDMSLNLTKLTADMASFYNVEQDVVAEKLASVFTGQTRPLRDFGLDLTQATLQEWALKQGIDANIQSMSQAEKTMLRYQYVMANTQAVHGDFARTSGSWANQVRILSQNFQQLAGIVGGVLVNAFKPVIKAANAAMSAIIAFAKVISNALGKIFGWTYEEGGGGGIAQDFGGAAEAADDLAGSTGKAAKNIKEMKAGLRAFDELKTINMPDSGAGGGGGGGGGGAGGGGAAGDGGQWVKGESILKQFESNINSLYDLGKYIGDKLTEAMNNIDWDSVYERARNFGTGLAEFLNGLISPELFGAVGRTIAGALNTAIYTALSFGETFDWGNLGLSIATGINEFFDTFDFKSLADTIDAWVKGIWDTVKTAILNVDWKDVWNGAKEFLENIDLETVAIIIGTLTIKKILGMHLASKTLSFIGTTLSQKIAQAIASKLGISIASNAGIGTALSSALSSKILGAISGVFTTLSAGIKALFGSNAAQSALTFVSPILKAFTGIGAAISGVLIAIKSFFDMWKNGFNWLKEALMVIGTTLAAVGAVILGAPALVAGIVAGIVAAIATAIVLIKENWDGIVEFFGNIFEKINNLSFRKWGEFINFLSGIPNKVSEIIENIASWFSQLPDKIGYGLGYALGTITKWGVDVYSYLSKKIPEIIENVKSWFLQLPDKIYTAISAAISKITTWGAEVLEAFRAQVESAISNVVAWFSKMPRKIYDAIILIRDRITEWASNTISFFQTEIPKIIDKVVEFFSELPDRIKEVGENLVTGLWNGIQNKVDWLGANIRGFVDGVVRGFKEGFDEHSPSKIAFEIGDFFTIGLGEGITDKFDGIYKDIINFGKEISSIEISSPQYLIPPSDIGFSQNRSLESQFSSAGATFQADINASMISRENEIREQNRLLREQNELLRAIYEKPALSDDDVFNSTRRGQQKYQSRTWKTGWAGVD